MKTLIASALIAFTATAGAYAAPSSIELNTIAQYAGGADVSGLSNADVKALLQTIHSGDSVSEIRADVKNAVRTAG